MSAAAPDTDRLAGRSAAVVGGAGFVGSTLVGLLLLGGARVTVIDNLLSADARSLPDDPSLTFVEASITDDAGLRAIPGDADWIFHLATYHGNQNSIAEPLADHQNNTLTTLRLLEHIATQEMGARVVYSSAGCTVAAKTFDEASATEEDDLVSLHLDSPYQISKVVGEFYANYYRHRHGVDTVKARFQNVYGPGEILGAGAWRGTPSTVWRNVVPTFVYRALKGMPLPVENGGIATRDFIYVEDIADGLIRCALNANAGEVLNLASGVETSILELAETINDICDNPGGIDLTPAREWDRSGKRFGATEKAEREIGFRARMELREGLERTVDWTRANLELIDECIGRHRDRVASLS